MANSSLYWVWGVWSWPIVCCRKGVVDIVVAWQIAGGNEQCGMDEVKWVVLVWGIKV